MYVQFIYIYCNVDEKNLPDLHKALEFEFSGQVSDLSAIFKSLQKKDGFI